MHSIAACFCYDRAPGLSMSANYRALNLYLGSAFVQKSLLLDNRKTIRPSLPRTKYRCFPEIKSSDDPGSACFFSRKTVKTNQFSSAYAFAKDLPPKDAMDLPPQDLQALHSRANILRLDGSYAEARALYEQLVAMAEAEHGPEHPKVGAALNDLAQVLHFLGNYPLARSTAERALKINEAALGPNHFDVSRSLFEFVHH